MKVEPEKALFFKLSGVVPSDVVRYLKNTTKVKFRYYEDFHWYVHLALLEDVIRLAYEQLGHVDYSRLPGDLQINIAQKKVGWQRGVRKNKSKLSEPTKNYHAVLHLMPTAPPVLVKAAYKALAFKYHPDRGGDVETFKQIQEAYDNLKE
jgi:hypothetical protein